MKRLAAYIKRRRAQYNPTAREQWLFLIGLIAFGLVGIAFPAFPLGWLYLNAALTILLSALLLIPHELSHALVARLLGLRVCAIILGTGKLLWCGRAFGVPVQVRAVPVAGMVTFSLASSRLMRLRRFFTYLAGPAANGVLLVVVLVLVPGHRLYPLDRPPTPLNELGAKWLPDRLLVEFDFVLANAVLLVGNLWPRILSIGGMRLESDGLALLYSWRWRSAEAEPSGNLRKGAGAFVIAPLLVLCANRKPARPPGGLTPATASPGRRS